MFRPTLYKFNRGIVFNLPSVATKKQHQMFSYAVANPYSILASDPRTGKSMVAILLRKLRNCNCLIIAPAYLLANWKKEILKWDSSAIVTVFQKGKDIYEEFDADFVVTSYALMQKSEHLFEWADLVIVDEIHNFAQINTLRSQFLHRVIYENAPKYFHGLTGTPIKNRTKEFYSPLALTYYDPVRPDNGFLAKYPDEITFAEHFSFPETKEVVVRGGRIMHVTSYKGLRNRDELKKWLKGRYIRIRASDKDLPPLSFVETLVQDIDNSKLYQAFKDFFISDQEAYAKAGATSGKRSRFNLLAMAAARKHRTGSVLPEHKRNAALQKVPFTIKYVENLLQSVDCLLIYSDHREPIEKIARHFGVPAITGGMPGSKRGHLVNDFQSGKLNILCATVGALKEGADLYRAKDLVFNDFPWVVGDITQVCARTRKIGEKDPRTIHLIFGSPQDEKIWQVLNEKRETINLATN